MRCLPARRETDIEQLAQAVLWPQELNNKSVATQTAIPAPDEGVAYIHTKYGPQH